MYGANSTAYAKQLKALEHAAEDQPDSPNTQFLLAYHYAFSERRSDASKLLDHVLVMAPETASASALRDWLRPKDAPPEANPPRVLPTRLKNAPTLIPVTYTDL